MFIIHSFSSINFHTNIIHQDPNTPTPDGCRRIQVALCPPSKNKTAHNATEAWVLQRLALNQDFFLRLSREHTGFAFERNLQRPPSSVQPFLTGASRGRIARCEDTMVVAPMEGSCERSWRWQGRACIAEARQGKKSSAVLMAHLYATTAVGTSPHRPAPPP